MSHERREAHAERMKLQESIAGRRRLKRAAKRERAEMARRGRAVEMTMDANGFFFVW